MVDGSASVARRDVGERVDDTSSRVYRQTVGPHVAECRRRTVPRASRRRVAGRQRRAIMAKVLHCGDLMPGCKTVIEGQDVDEVMKKGAEHAKSAHGMSTIPPDMAKKVQAAIKDK
jgi:predicted small metal-binding protein